MKVQTQHTCAVCGKKRWDGDPWFLLVDSHWQDRLKILEWNDQLALQSGIACACSAVHVEQLVVQWMTAGTLDHPFAISLEEEPNRGAGNGRAAAALDSNSVDTSGLRLIGELAVHRESMMRVLNESPHSLAAIMEALLCALRKETPHGAQSLECEELELCSPHREI